MTTNHLAEYEKKFADLVGAKAARATALGRQALALLLKATGVRQGDKVGLCAYTCLSVVEAVKVTGAIPVYLDVDDSLCIAPESIHRQKPGSLKVIILQHTFGNPGKLDQLLDACKKIEVKVIEDCAHTLGCHWDGKPLGQFGVGAIYSFEWGKPYTTGAGGMLTTNSVELLERIDVLIGDLAVNTSFLESILLEIQRGLFNILNGTGVEMRLRRAYRLLRDKYLTRPTVDVGDDWELKQGYIQRPDNLTVKAGMRQIRQWPNSMKNRRQNAKVIEQQLRKNGIQLWPKQSHADVTYLRYPVRVSAKSELLSRASKLSLDLAGWYFSPVHPLNGKDLNKVGYFAGMAGEAEKSIEQIVHMPTGRRMTSKKIRLIVQLISETCQ